MAQRRLLSGSGGTFWGVVNEGEWIGPLLLKNATVMRTQNKLGSPQDIISSSGSSDNGLVNTVTLLDVASSYDGGTSPGCAYFGFPLTKEDGSPLDLGKDRFTVDMFLEITNNPGETDNNKCFVFMGINDGDTDLDATIGTGFTYLSAQQLTVFSTGGSRTNIACNTDGFPYLRATMTTAPSGSNPTYSNPFNGITTFAYDGNDNDFINDRVLEGDTIYGTKYQSSGLPIGSQAYAYVALGRTATGQGEKTFSFKAYYKLSLHTKNGVPTERPG